MEIKVVNWEATRKHAKTLTKDALEYTIKDCMDARDANFGWNPNGEGYYQDLASVYNSELKGRK